MLTSHRDDHLRNHGFLRTGAGWELAPAFDLNPMPEMVEHELAIDEAVHAGDMGLVVETTPFYRLTRQRGHGIRAEVRSALATWRDFAASVPLGEDAMGTLPEAIAA